MKESLPYSSIREVQMNTRNFWPLDFDPEGEIYESVAWDLPGFKNRRAPHPSKPRRHSQKSRRE